MSAMYLNYVGRGGSKVVSVFAFYFDDPSSTPAKHTVFSSLPPIGTKSQLNETETR